MVSFKKTFEWRATAMHKLVSFAQPLYRKLSRRNQPAWNITGSQLLSFEADTLGRELGIFLKDNKFTLMAQFETHDIFHVLLNYQPTVLDEARMQFCLVGSGKKSLFSFGTCLIAILFYPEYCMDFKRHYQRGESLTSFASWDYQTLLGSNLKQLQLSLQKETNSHKDTYQYDKPFHDILRDFIGNRSTNVATYNCHDRN